MLNIVKDKANKMVSDLEEIDCNCKIFAVIRVSQSFF